jgi:hypothetical protein
LLLEHPRVPSLRRELVRFVFECRWAILDCFVTRDSEGFEEVDSFFTLQFQLMEAFYQSLFCLGSGCKIRENSAGVVVVDLLKCVLPASHSLALVPLYRAHQLL